MILNVMTSNNHIAAEYPHFELTDKIIKCAKEVHNRIGNGFHEVVYKRSLAHEFFFQNIPFERETDMVGNNREIGLTDCADFLVNGKVMVELKSIMQFDDAHLTQTIDYLEASNLEVGLLINFGGKYLDFKRVINMKYHSQS